MNKYLERAYAELPGYRQALELADQATAMLGELRPPEPIDPQLDPLRTGKITSQWLDALDAHDAATATLERRRNRLITLRRDAQGQASSSAALNLNKLLSVLHTELTRLLNEADSVAAQLHGASSAEQAIANDAGEAWKKLSQLAGDYAELRAAQAELMRFAPHDVRVGARPAGGLGEEHASDLYIANLDEIWPGWRTPDYRRSVRLGGEPERLEPWPTDPTQLLLWLVTSPAQPWVPTTKQLDDLRAHRIAKSNPMPKVIKGTSRAINQPTRVR